MERIGDDELISIFDKLVDEDDRKSFLQVSRKFMKAACMRVCELHIWSPDMLYDILPASPNLVTFRCYKLLSYNHMKLLAQSCPKLSNLYLSLYYDDDDNDSDYYYDDAYFEFDDGLCEVANACRDLLQVDLSDRPNVGDVGVGSLVRSCKGLTVLKLNGCIGVTDKSLKAIGEASGLLHDLDLRGCCITDLGLQYLAYGKVKNTSLRYLHLGRCGADVTDIGVVQLLSQLPNIETLDLCMLINFTDFSLNVIASTCLNLKVFHLMGCQAITVEGLCAFAHHPTLETVGLISCHNISWKDVKSFALSCPSLRCLELSSSLKMSIPDEDYIYKINNCRIYWR